MIQSKCDMINVVASQMEHYREDPITPSHYMLYNFVPYQAGHKFKVPCLNHESPKIENLKPKMLPHFFLKKLIFYFRYLAKSAGSRTSI